MPVTGLLPEVSRLAPKAGHGYADVIPRAYMRRIALKESCVEFFAEYASFLAKTVTLVVAILIVLAAFASLRSKGRRKSAGQLQVSKLNDFYKGLRERLEQSLLDKDRLKALRKEQVKSLKKERKKADPKSRVYVLDFNGDIKAS